MWRGGMNTDFIQIKDIIKRCAQPNLERGKFPKIRRNHNSVDRSSDISWSAWNAWQGVKQNWIWRCFIIWFFIGNIFAYYPLHIATLSFSASCISCVQVLIWSLNFQTNIRFESVCMCIHLSLIARNQRQWMHTLPFYGGSKNSSNADGSVSN